MTRSRSRDDRPVPPLSPVLRVSRGRRLFRWPLICWSSARIRTTSKSASAAPWRRHAAHGLRVGLCDLTAGEMGTNGTPDERLAEAERRRRACSAPRGAKTCDWPDGADIGTRSRASCEQAVAVHPARIGRAPWRRPTGRIGIPITSAASEALTEAVFNGGLRRYQRRDGEPWRARMGLLLLHQRRRRAVVRRRRVGALRPEARRARLPREPVSRTAADAETRPRRGSTRRSSGSSSRAATRNSAPWPAWPGPKASSCASRSMRASLRSEGVTMNIGIICYASVGGSGIIATELAKALASRGHRRARAEQRHARAPRRLSARPHVSSRGNTQLSAVPGAAVSAIAREQDRPGVARRAARHRACPLRDSARDGGVSRAGRFLLARVARSVPRVVTTLHGTDITLLGSDRSYSEIVAFCDPANRTA